MTIYLAAKRRTMLEWVQKIQHLIGGLPLLVFGLERLQNPEERVMAAVEVAVALAVCGAFVYEAISHRKHSKAGHHHSSHIFGWFDLAAGAMLLMEAFSGHHHKPGYLRPPFTAGMFTLALGLFHKPFSDFVRRRRFITLSNEQLEYKVVPFREVAIPWSDLASLDTSMSKCVLRGKDGNERTISFSSFHNGEEARIALEDYARSVSAVVKRLN